MSALSILIIISSVIFVLIVWTVFGYIHLQGFKKVLADQWEKIYLLVRKRQDMVPNLIETVRVYSKNDEVLLQELIRYRQVAVQFSHAIAQKVEAEILLNKEIAKTFMLEKGNNNLAIDTNFLELKKDFRDNQTAIIMHTNNYNDMVRQYNNSLGGILFAPLGFILGYRKANIFEVEFGNF